MLYALSSADQPFCYTVWIQIRTDGLFGPDLDLNCLKWWSADDKSNCKQGNLNKTILGMDICIFNVYICCLSLLIFMFNNSTCKVFLVTFCIIDPANCIHHYMHFCHLTITSLNSVIYFGVFRRHFIWRLWHHIVVLYTINHFALKKE